MGKYIIRRLLLSIVTFFGITVFVFAIANLAPGTPLDALLAEPGMTEADAIRRAAALGIDKPVYVQYFSWVKAFLQGDLGFSYRTFQKVTTMVGERIGPTLLLSGTAILLSGAASNLASGADGVYMSLFIALPM
ncbi:MAG: hypothetical protein PHE70_12185, partial [Tepidanaerobacteraceae bacterium]|nr:hypothetical protein [Tepidanaerobacteraceae bacterium]